MQASTEAADPLRVLIVDDHPDILWTTKGLFCLSGYEVETAATGRSALEAARTFRPDVVILDIGLPDQDGREVAAELRQSSDGEDPLIIGISGFAPEGEDESYEVFDHYLTKPAEMDEMLTIIGEHCGPRAAGTVVKLDWWG